jgi:hypothetical protein
MLSTSMNIHGIVKMQVRATVFPEGLVTQTFVFTDDEGRAVEISAFSANYVNLERLGTQWIEPPNSDIPVGEATEVTP